MAQPSGNIGSKVRFEIVSGVATSEEPACILVYEDNRLIAEIIATAEYVINEDGKYEYTAVIKFQKKN